MAYGGSTGRVTFAGARADVVILSCAISAGIHAALVPDHFEEGAGAGVGFTVAAVVLGVLSIVLTRAPNELAFGAAATVLAGLIASYALAATSGFPILHPEPEAVDALALFTKAVEAVGLVLAASLLRPRSLTLAVRQPKGTLT